MVFIRDFMCAGNGLKWCISNRTQQKVRVAGLPHFAPPKDRTIKVGLAFRTNSKLKLPSTKPHLKPSILIKAKRIVKYPGEEHRQLQSRREMIGKPVFFITRMSVCLPPLR